MGALIIWLVVMVPVSALLTGLGIFAWRRQKPMWFWSGQTVGEDEIGDVKAYNRANYLTHPGVDVTGILQRIS